MAKHVEQLHLFTGEQAGHRRSFSHEQAARPRAQPGCRHLRQACDQSMTDHLDGVMDPVGGQDAGRVLVLVVQDRDQHIGVGADLRGEVHEEGGEIASGGQPDGRLERLWKGGLSKFHQD